MIKTKGDFVSEIRNHLKSLNKDDYIPARFIISTAETFIQYLINTRPLSNTMRALNSFTMIECIEMERVKSHKCDVAEFRVAEKIMKSKKPLPGPESWQSLLRLRGVAYAPQATSKLGARHKPE